MDSPAAPAAAIATAVPARLEPDAIGVGQDTVIGMANAAPAASVGLVIAGIVTATVYGSVPSVLICAIPMIVIANAYRRLNMWNANSGTSFEWVGRAINPYLGFMTGWFIIAGITIGTSGTVVLLGPSVLAVFGANATSKWANTGIAVAVCLVMLLIAVLGIKLTARTQVVMAAVEYVILIAFAIWGLHAVLSHHAGTVPITRGWFNIHGIGGKGSLAGGLLIAVFMYSGWEGTLYVNEEVRHRRLNPGRAAIIATVTLAVIYAFSMLGLQGVLSTKALNNASSPLIAIGQALGGGNWAKLMALAIALSVIATVGCGILLAARVIYGMAMRQVLPDLLGNVNRRFSTPANASMVAGGFLIAVTVVYLLATSLQNAFSDVISVTSDLAISYYALTTMATIVYYRRRIMTGVGEALTLGILPLAAIAFLVWVLYKQLTSASADENWSLLGIVGVGVLLMLAARFILRSAFFHVPLESDRPGQS